MAGQMPILNFNQDNYANWLLTNSNSLNAQKIGATATTGLGILSLLASLGLIISGVGTPLAIGGLMLGGIGTSAGGIVALNSAVQSEKDHSMIPDSVSGLASGSDINAVSGTNGFWFYDYSIKREFAEIIDNYFDMFGYKVNKLEVPQLHTRINWNFLKVLNPNIEGANVPEKDMNKFKNQLQQGITFWHNPNTFRDYSQSNGNVT